MVVLPSPFSPSLSGARMHVCTLMHMCTHAHTCTYNLALDSLCLKTQGKKGADRQLLTSQLVMLMTLHL